MTREEAIKQEVTMLSRTRTELEDAVTIRSVCLHHINVMLDQIRLTATNDGKKEGRILGQLDQARRNYITYCDQISTLNDQLARISARLHKLQKQ